METPGGSVVKLTSDFVSVGVYNIKNHFTVNESKIVLPKKLRDLFVCSGKTLLIFLNTIVRALGRGIVKDLSR